MKKTLPLLIFVFLYSILSAQIAKPSSAVTHKSTVNSAIKESNEPMIPYGTICFLEKGSAESVVLSKTSYNCSIKKFANTSEAEVFSNSFKNSDSNILTVIFTENKDGLYFFNFSVKEPKDTKWYLQLFKNNGLEFIKYNKDVNSIEELLSK